MNVKGNWFRTSSKRYRSGQKVIHFFIENNSKSICGTYPSCNTITIIPNQQRQFGHTECKNCQREIAFFKTTGLKQRPKEPTYSWIKLKKNSTLYSVKQSEGKFVKTTCPECGTNVVFWNAKKQTEHYCTSCNELVHLQLGAILS